MRRTRGTGRTIGLSALVVGTALLCAACFVPYDLNGDNRADLVFMNSNTGSWYRYGSPDVIRAGGGLPMVGNYDGNAKWELAEANASNWPTAGSRGVIGFAAPTVPTPGFPIPSRMAVPARYDGNNTTKPAWYGTAEAKWYIEGHDPIQFGTPAPPVDATSPPQADIPVPGDYDGDGTDELAVYHPSDSTFHVQGDPTPIHVGSVGDLPAPADYDHDGTTDPATITVAANGVTTWHVAGQADVVYPNAPLADPVVHPGGGLIVLPAPADYDGQGGVDLSVMVIDEATNRSTWRISTIGDLVLGPADTTNVNGEGAEIAGPANFNDSLVILMVHQAQVYCATHTC